MLDKLNTIRSIRSRVIELINETYPIFDSREYLGIIRVLNELDKELYKMELQEEDKLDAIGRDLHGDAPF